MQHSEILIEGANEHNLKNIDVRIPRNQVTVVTGVSGSGKSSLAFDTLLAESQRRFFYTLSHYTRQFLDLGTRPDVRRIEGLSPAISLAQNETKPSRKATVGTLTDISELVAVALARFGEQRCPKHNLVTSALSLEDIVDRILKDVWTKDILVAAPIVEQKKGIFAKEFNQFAEKGYSRAYVDGEVLSLANPPSLMREEKHTIKIIVDHLNVKEKNRTRLLRAIKVAMDEGGGVGEYAVVPDSKILNDKNFIKFSAKSGCPECGFAWPNMDSRYFSANSLGRCQKCLGYGYKVLHIDEDDNATEEDEGVEEEFEVCASCRGTGVDTEKSAVKLMGLNIQDILLTPLQDLKNYFEGLKLSPLYQNPAFVRVVNEIISLSNRIIDVGLGYLHLARRVRTLSQGESQRLKLACILQDSLRGVMYVLDEPSQGLHPHDIDRLWQSLSRLKNLGNTLIIVDHDEMIMHKADKIIDLGPTGGAKGGHIVAQFSPQEAKNFVDISETARGLTEQHLLKAKKQSKDSSRFLTIHQAHLHNLNIPKVDFLVGGLNVVSGVSGAGKSSLVIHTLFRNILNRFEKEEKHIWNACKKIDGLEYIDSVTLIDRSPVAKSSVSIPASYIDILTDIRNLFADLPDAQIAGLTARSFSIHSEGGRCEECKGRGEKNISMRFLTDARVKCPACLGKRFRPHVLDVLYNGLSIYDVLSLSVDEGYDFFKNHRRIINKLEPAKKLGLGYLKLGQSSASLSGGEAQRLKLVPFFSKNFSEKNLIILDEPTTGLHFKDAEKLLLCLRELADKNVTLIVIEHNLNVLAQADWIVDLGPGSASHGGNLLFQGPLEAFLKNKDSLTAKYLKTKVLVQ